MNKSLIAGVIATAASGYLFWQYLMPVQIVAVHEGNTILVRHFPYLKSSQIAWWEANKDMIHAKYGIPHKDDNGYYSITVMGFGKGFRTQPNESLLFSSDEVYCFEEMVTNAKCIDRDTLFSVDETPSGGLRYQSH